MLADRTTLNQFLTEERRRHPGATGEFTALVNDVALACKAIAKRVAYGAIDDVLGSTATTNVQGEAQQKVRRARQWALPSHQRMGRASRRHGFGGNEIAVQHSSKLSKGRYLLVFDPLDGSSDIDVNVSSAAFFQS